MRPCCPLCGADHCPEERPDCRARGDARRALYDSANGFELTESTGNRAALRAEVARLRRKVATLRARKGRAR